MPHEFYTLEMKCKLIPKLSTYNLSTNVVDI